jgi:hypothetical protein
MTRLPTAPRSTGQVLAAQSTSYPQQASAALEPEMTLLAISSSLRDKLGDIHGRLNALRDHLLGAQPREVMKDSAPEPQPSVRHNLYVGTDILNDVVGVISELEHML